MVETTYNRSYSALHTDDPPGFDSQFNQRQFHNEVDTDGGITPNLLRVDRTGDSIDIVFDASLSTGEETTLNGLIAAHTPDTTLSQLNYQTFSIKKPEVTGNGYGIKDRVAFRGGTYAKIYSISYMDSGVTSYSIKIFDRTNGNTIIEKTGLNNTSESLQLLGVGSSISADKAVWEVQAETVGGAGNKIAHVDSIYIEYA